MSDKYVAFLLSCGHYQMLAEDEARAAGLRIGDSIVCELCATPRPIVRPPVNV